MEIPLLGQLSPHPDIPEWLVSQPVAIRYFDGLQLAFTLDGLEASDESDTREAIESFLKLDSVDRIAASPYVFKNYQQIASVLRKEDIGCEIAAEIDVWKHVRPTEIFVSRRNRGSRAICIQILAECDWEPEHGLQIIFRDGRVLSRVSAQDGHLTHADAHGLPEDQDRIV